MKRKHNVVMLSQERDKYNYLKKGNITLFNNKLRIDTYYEDGIPPKGSKNPMKYVGAIPQHLYFTSIDEEIKEGDWFIGHATNSPNECLSSEHAEVLNKAEKRRRKIIATTNSDLWITTFRINANMLNYNTRTIPTGIGKIGVDFIEAYVKQYNSGTPINEVYLEIQQYDVKGRKTDTEHIDNLYSTKLKLRNNGTVIISPVDERKYTREEVLETIKDSIYIGMSSAYEHDTSTEALERGIKLFNKKYPQ